MIDTLSLPALRRGDRDPAGGTRWVHRVQALLGVVGYAVDVDGVYRQATAQAVKRLQRETGLPITGEVDARTWSVLIAGLTDPKETT